MTVQYTPMESSGAASAGGGRGRRLCAAGGAVLVMSALANLLLAATLFHAGTQQPQQPQQTGQPLGLPQPGALDGRQAQLLPPMRYRFTSFAVTDPAASAAFVRRYLGAAPLRPAEFLTHRQVAKWAVDG